MIIILNKPTILYDEQGNIKSWNYFNNTIKGGKINMDVLTSLPIIFILCAMISFYLAKYLDD